MLPCRFRQRPASHVNIVLVSFQADKVIREIIHLRSEIRHPTACGEGISH
jgi:hypothetical protein